MIPQNLRWAFEEGHHVHTYAGTGKMKQRRLADLILPSGKIATGYPGDGFSNKPNEIQPQVSPGSYPVSINIVRNKGSVGAFAFVTVRFTDTETTSWESAGHFFTDSGDGCIFDYSVVDLLRKKKVEMPREEWGLLKQPPSNMEMEICFWMKYLGRMQSFLEPATNHTIALLGVIFTTKSVV